MAERLPAAYQEDSFTTRFTEALDGVLAPVFATLDCFGAYLDPALAPEDFLAWLAGWVAVPLDEQANLEQRRALVANAVELHRWRGTARGIARFVELLTGGEVTVTDSGGTSWSPDAGPDRPGDDGPPWVRVRVLVDDPATFDEARLRRAVAEMVPVHVRATVEIAR
jgi:phage tail-like protein